MMMSTPSECRCWC